MPLPTRIVFSDVDETLVRSKSLFDFLDFYFSERFGAAGARHAEDTRSRLAAMLAAGASRDDGNRAYYQAWKGQCASDVADWGVRWFAWQRMRDDFYVPETHTALRQHQAEGALVVLVSGGFPAVLDPIAADIGARQVLCTRPEVRDGTFTGAIAGTPVIGEGKRACVREVLRTYPHVDPADCYSYGDHVSDLPMLTEVGHPVVVGDSPELLAAVFGTTSPST